MNIKELCGEVLLTLAIIAFASAFVALAILSFVCCNISDFKGTTEQIVGVGIGIFLVTFFGLTMYAINYAFKQSEKKEE